MRAYRLLEWCGTAIVLQLCFLLCALGVVTALPAAIALQRQWRAFGAGEVVTVRTYGRAFLDAVRQAWVAGLALAAVIALYLIAVDFWRSSDSLPGSLALGFLFGLAYLGLSAYLAFLAVAGRRTDVRWRGWFGPSRELLLRRVPWFALGAAVVVVSWVVISYLPPLALVLIGIVPAIAAERAAGREPVAEAGQASRS